MTHPLPPIDLINKDKHRFNIDKIFSITDLLNQARRVLYTIPLSQKKIPEKKLHISLSNSF
jgi:hypothetical protein